MRTLPVNGMLTSLSTNYNRRNKNVKLYELAKVYLAADDVNEPQMRELCSRLEHLEMLISSR